MRVLIIEDDQSTADYIQTNLTAAGHIAAVANDGAAGLAMANAAEYDALVIDRMLPKIDGLSIIANLRATDNTTPALILSALGEVEDRIDGLQAGGDDYLNKPFAFAELLARLEALVRRAAASSAATTLTVGELHMDLIGRAVKRGEHIMDLNPREFELLEYLMRHSDQVVTRAMLLESVWDYNFDPQTNVIDVHISRLRAKIDKNFAAPLINTVRGAGYILREPQT